MSRISRCLLLAAAFPTLVSCGERSPDPSETPPPAEDAGVASTIADPNRIRINQNNLNPNPAEVEQLKRVCWEDSPTVQTWTVVMMSPSPFENGKANFSESDPCGTIEVTAPYGEEFDYGVFRNGGQTSAPGKLRVGGERAIGINQNGPVPRNKPAWKSHTVCWKGIGGVTSWSVNIDPSPFVDDKKSFDQDDPCGQINTSVAHEDEFEYTSDPPGNNLSANPDTSIVSLPKIVIIDPGGTLSTDSLTN